MQRRREPRGKGERLRVAVLMGGPSEEHEVSLQGGQNVVCALSPKLYHARPVFISKEGEWRLPPRGWMLPEPEGTSAGASGFDAHDSEGWRIYPGPCEALVALREWQTDLAIPVLHGRFGEDGTVQACLAAAQIPYVGSDMAASATAFDKIRAKEILRYHDIDTPDFEVVHAGEIARGRHEHIEGWIERLGLPLVIKNPCGGSSQEVRMAADAGHALTAIEELAPPAERLLIEEYVEGRELTVGVLEDRANGPRALPVVEIRPRDASFFDYQQKYSSDGAEELCPAPLPDEVAARARALALDVHRLFGLRGLSRTDLFLTEAGALRVLEVNTLPGMTARGLVPLAAAVEGLDFAGLVSELVRSARLPGQP